MYKISITAMQTVFTILTYVKLLKKTYIGIYLTL